MGIFEKRVKQRFVQKPSDLNNEEGITETKGRGGEQPVSED